MKKPKPKESAPVVPSKPVLVSGALVIDILNYLGGRPLAESLPLFHRLLSETKTQLPAPPAPKAA
jgi:hypothetical protein